jgi:hypothetical protein
LRYFLLFDETNPKAANRIYRATTVIWLVLTGIGLLASLDRRQALWPTYSIFFVVAAFHALVIVSARFRIPVEPLSFIWVATAFAPLVTRVARSGEIKVYRPGERPMDSSGKGHALRGPHWKTRRDRRVA